MKKRFSWVVVLIFSLANCFCQPQSQDNQYDSYLVLAADEEGDDLRWTDYLQSQLDRRRKTRPQTISGEGTTLEIVVDVDPAMKSEYAVVRQKDRLTLRAKNPDSMLWLLYQFIAWISQYDDHLEALDLPPALLDMNRTCEGTFAFEYRGIYSPTNSDPDFMAINASHNIDYDWGLWGHNLRKVLDGEASDEVFAWTQGKRDHRQFCFSSEDLYTRLVAYILDNYGDGIVKNGPNKGQVQGSRFCIMPDDNNIVCQCEKCRQAGNTAQSATPAVVKMMQRVAERFPNHRFFTTSYLTTKNPPSMHMPENTGVLISAIDFPLSYGFESTSQAADFAAKIKKWRAVTPNIYVWDYMRNFDDYLTPFPVLGVLEKRLAFFKQQGVSGVFYNGSGYDYASLDDVQTFALASMLKSDSLSWSSIVKKYLDKFYPQSGASIYEYYHTLEEWVAQNPVALEYYGGIDAAIQAYLIPTEFENFYTRLDAVSKKISGDERVRLNRLLTALNYTLLELMRTPNGLPYNAEKVEECLCNLSGYTAFPDMKYYKEANGALAAYIDSWNKYNVYTASDHSLKTDFKFSSTEANDQPIPLLSNGFHGFPSDYHTGWYQFRNGEVVGECEIGEACTIVVSGGFLYAPQWKIDLPGEVYVLVNDKRCCEGSFVSTPVPFSKQFCRFELPVAAGDRVKIVVQPCKTTGYSVACDEIEIYEKR